MSLIVIVLTLIVIGVLMFLLNNYGKKFIEAKMLQIINFVVILATILWLLRVFGVWDYLFRITV